MTNDELAELLEMSKRELRWSTDAITASGRSMNAAYPSNAIPAAVHALRSIAASLAIVAELRLLSEKERRGL